MDIKEDLLLWFIIFFYKKVDSLGVNIRVKHNEELAEELHKPILTNFKQRKVIWDLQIIFGELNQLICN